MKVTTLFGGPRKQGNTETALGWFEEELENQGHEIDRINLVDLDVRGCLGCGKCWEVTDKPGCVQKDEALAVFERMMAADAVVYASPLYCWSFSSQLKALIDRHVCLVKGYGTAAHKSFIEGKRTALLVTCGGPIEGNADIIGVAFDRQNGFCKTETIGRYIIPGCTAPADMGQPARDVVNKMAQAVLNG